MTTPGGGEAEAGSASSRREWLTVALLSSVLVLLLQIPYLLGYWTAPPDMLYTGLLVNVEDANYITIIQRGREGAWAHSLRFTSEPDAPAFLYVFYLALGQGARIVRADATSMWHAARIALTFLVFLLTYGFVRAFVPVRSWRMVAYLLAILGGGFDWFAFPWETLAVTSATPVDLKMADAHLFASALTFPHYLASICCMLIVFWCAVRLLTENLSGPGYWLTLSGGALANLGTGLVYPFFVILTGGVLVVYAAALMLLTRRVLWRETGIVALMIAPVLPLVVYYQVALSSSPLLQVWSAQSRTLSPNPLHYVLTFAPYLILAALELRWGERGDPRETKRRALLWAWVAVVAVLAYSPLNMQRRFLQGVQIPLAILAALGWFEVVLPRMRQANWFQGLARRPNYSAEGLGRLLSALLILVVAISSVYQWLSAATLTAFAQPYPLFRPRGEVAAMDWLGTVAGAEDVVLCAYFTGSYLPLRSGARVYLGHYYETIHFQEKQDNVDFFFHGATPDAARVQFLRENGIDFVFYGNAERELGTFDPSKALYLHRIHEDGEATIYQVAAGGE